MLLAVLFACEKEDVDADDLKSLAGTEWTGAMPDYYTGSVVIKVISDTQATITAGDTSIPFTYTYNSSLQTGVIESGGITFIFEIDDNNLKVIDDYGSTYNFIRTK